MIPPSSWSLILNSLFKFWSTSVKDEFIEEISFCEISLPTFLPISKLSNFKFLDEGMVPPSALVNILDTSVNNFDIWTRIKKIEDFILCFIFI